MYQFPVIPRDVKVQKQLVALTDLCVHLYSQLDTMVHGVAIKGV